MGEKAGEPVADARFGMPMARHISAPGAFLDACERTIGRVIDAICASLLLVDIGLLGWGVTARYLLHWPMIWVEELATLLFLWFGMLGAASALRRGWHMRLSFVSALAPPALGRRIDQLASAILLIFMGTLLWPSLALVQLNSAIRTPDLGIPDSFAAAATPVSLVVMIALLLIRLRRSSTAPAFALVCAGVLGVIVAITRINPVMAGLGNFNLLIFFGLGVGALIVIGVPIAFAFGAATLAYFVLTSQLPLVVIVGRINEGMSQYILLTIPLFIFLGAQIQYTGMARSMVDFLAAVFGRVRGGLSYVLLCTMYLVSGISGAKAADMAAIGPILIPAMKERGTREGDAVALLATAAATAETIPPSLVLIIIGSVTGVSIAALFRGGVLPAVVSMLALSVVIFIRARRERPGAGRRDLRRIGRTFLVALPGLILPFLIRAAVLGGVATATEVAVIGVIYVFVVGLVTMRTLSLRRMGALLSESTAMSGAVMIIIALAGAMSWTLIQSGFAQALAHFMTHLPGGKPGFFAVSIGAFAVLGSILEGIPAIVLFGPLLFPAAEAMGIHPVHYAIVVLLSMGLGLFAPPFGYGYYMASAIARVSPDKAMKSMAPYLLAFAIAICIIATFPWLSVGIL